MVLVAVHARRHDDVRPVRSACSHQSGRVAPRAPAGEVDQGADAGRVQPGRFGDGRLDVVQLVARQQGAGLEQVLVGVRGAEPGGGHVAEHGPPHATRGGAHRRTVSATAWHLDAFRGQLQAKNLGDVLAPAVQEVRPAVGDGQPASPAWAMAWSRKASSPR